MSTNQSANVLRARLHRVGAVALVFFILLAPHSLLAKSSSGCGERARPENSSPELLKTPREFLLDIKEFMRNPAIDSHDFIEKLTCVDRDKWKNKEIIKWIWVENAEGDLFKTKKVPYEGVRYDFVHDNASIPFKDLLIVMEKKHGFLAGLMLYGPADSFRLTPADIRAVFGAPERIYASSPRDEFSVGRISVKYFYWFGNYRLEFATEDTLRYFKQMKNLQDKEIDPRAYMKEYKHHAAYRITYVEIARQKNQWYRTINGFWYP